MMVYQGVRIPDGSPAARGPGLQPTDSEASLRLRRRRTQISGCGGQGWPPCPGSGSSGPPAGTRAASRAACQATGMIGLPHFVRAGSDPEAQAVTVTVTVAASLRAGRPASASSNGLFRINRRGRLTDPHTSVPVSGPVPGPARHTLEGCGSRPARASVPPAARRQPPPPGLHGVRRCASWPGVSCHVMCPSVS
jgi:hypothetical protein